MYSVVMELDHILHILVVIWSYSISNYNSVVVNFDSLAQASDFQIERRQVVFLCWMQDLNQGILNRMSISNYKMLSAIAVIYSRILHTIQSQSHNRCVSNCQITLIFDRQFRDSKFREIWWIRVPISRLRYFTNASETGPLMVCREVGLWCEDVFTWLAVLWIERIFIIATHIYILMLCGLRGNVTHSFKIYKCFKMQFVFE